MLDRARNNSCKIKKNLVMERRGAHTMHSIWGHGDIRAVDELEAGIKDCGCIFLKQARFSLGKLEIFDYEIIVDDEEVLPRIRSLINEIVQKYWPHITIHSSLNLLTLKEIAALSAEERVDETAMIFNC